MSEERRQETPLIDQAALVLQRLHADEKLGGCDTLLRIDNRAEAREAPFQLDAASGTLHRNGCPAIAPSSRSALYGFWWMGSEEQARACKRCKPVPDEKPTVSEAADRTDLLFGVISVVNQFAGVLRERGRDFQKTSDGQKLNEQVRAVYQTLGRREKEVLDTVFSFIDLLTNRVREMDRDLGGTPPADRD